MDSWAIFLAYEKVTAAKTCPHLQIVKHVSPVYSPEVNIGSNDDSSYVIQQEPKVLHKRYVVLVQDGVEVGVVEALFDMTNVPPDLRLTAFMLIKNGFQLGIPSKGYLADLARFMEEEKTRHAARHWWEFWK